MTALREPRSSLVGSAQSPPLPPETDNPNQTLQKLVQEHQATVWRYLRYLGAESPEADDLTQETFLAVARAQQQGQFKHHTDRQTTAYLRTVARNGLLMLRRKQKREIKTTDLEAAERVWAETVDQDNQNTGWANLTDQLQGCLEKLAGKANRAIDLHYRVGASRAAIAEELGMKPDGVKTLLRRTRATLRECLQRGGD